VALFGAFSGNISLWDRGEERGVLQTLLIPFRHFYVPNAIDTHLVEVPKGLSAKRMRCESGINRGCELLQGENSRPLVYSGTWGCCLNSLDLDGSAILVRKSQGDGISRRTF
jgi:hypothetical protein